MTFDLKHSWPKLLLAAVVVIVPAFLSYLKTHEEVAAQIQLSNRQADAGYQALVESVKRLEGIVGAQSVALQLITRQLAEKTAVEYIPTPPLPSFEQLPETTVAALRQRTDEEHVRATGATGAAKAAD